MTAVADFVFLRPLWLLALLPLPPVIWLLSRRLAGAGRWQDIIDPHLLRVLLQTGTRTASTRWPLLCIAFAWLLATLALAGPSLRSQDSPLYQRASARVYVLDLSPSMNADDVKPSRLARARLKLLDALNQRRDGEQALLVYAGSAHVLTPLATDAKTLAAQVPVLTTALPPVSGNRPELAMQRAVQLLKDAGHSSGEIVWLTDGIDADQVERITAALQDQPVRLAVLAIGTADGAPIRSANGALLTDRAGKVILARLDLAPLQAVVNAVNGRLAPMQADDSDWQALQFPEQPFDGNTRRFDGASSVREDAGAWLVLPLLVLGLLAFRRGNLLPIVLVLTATFSPRSDANWWQDLWQTPDQQAAVKLKNGDAKMAAETFRNPDWQATARYRAGDYEAAAQRFAGSDATALFNRGNALANAGKLDEAIASYDKALGLQGDFTAARDNRDFVAKLKQQQQQTNPQQHDQQQKQQGQSGDSKANAKQKSEQQKSDEQQSPSEETEANNQQQQAGSAANESEQQQASTPEQQEAANQQQAERQAKKQAQQQAQQQQQADSQNGGQQTEATTSDDEQTLPANETPLPTALKQLPDDPGGLLRRKMKLEYLRRGQETQQQDQEQRW